MSACASSQGTFQKDLSRETSPDLTVGLGVMKIGEERDTLDQV